MSLEKQSFPLRGGSSQTELDNLLERAAESPIARGDSSPAAEPFIGSIGYGQLLGTGTSADAKCLENPTSPPRAGTSVLDLEKLVERIVELTIARHQSAPPKPFINSRECADLIGVTPEHLCSMRARGQGPPWSGSGKWIRYDRQAVLTWLAKL
jgi:hypothetical protein